MSSKTTYTLVVLGGSSAIGLAYVNQVLATQNANGKACTVHLLARDKTKLEADRGDLQAKGAEVIATEIDLINADQSDKHIGKLEAVDEVVLAYGTLTDQERAQQEDEYLAGQLAANFTSAARWLEAVARLFERQDYGRAVIIGSVAGDRGRQSNYAYGAAKSGLATFVQGMQHRFAASDDISFTLIKPGFVDTPMTAHIDNKGFLWASPEDVARAMEKAARKRSRTAYVPGIWFLIMMIIRNVPAFIFHKTKL